MNVVLSEAGTYFHLVCIPVSRSQSSSGYTRIFLSNSRQVKTNIDGMNKTSLSLSCPIEEAFPRTDRSWTW